MKCTVHPSFAYCRSWNWNELPHWCEFAVFEPHTEWETVRERAGSDEPDVLATTALSQVKIIVVEELDKVDAALKELFDSMKVSPLTLPGVCSPNHAAGVTQRACCVELGCSYSGCKAVIQLAFQSTESPRARRTP